MIYVYDYLNWKCLELLFRMYNGVLRLVLLLFICYSTFTVRIGIVLCVFMVINLLCFTGEFREVVFDLHTKYSRGRHVFAGTHCYAICRNV